MFRVGFSKVDMTPPLGSSLAGYYSLRIADGILDPLDLIAVAFNDGENTAVVISADLCGFHGTASLALRKRIAKEADIPVENIFIHCLHQHTSIKLGVSDRIYNSTSSTIFEEDAAYEIICRKFVDVTKMAIADLKDAEAGVASQETAEEISFIRRFLMKDGSAVTNPGPDRLHEVVGPLGEADNTVRLVRFKRENANDIAFVNFSTHPDLIGGTKISADWPGFARRFVEKDLEGVSCILINGPQGDTNHINIHNTNGGYEYSKHMGRVIADTVIDIWNKTEPRKATPITAQFKVENVPTNTKDIERIEEYTEMKKQYQEGTLKINEMELLADIYRVSKLYDQTIFQKVPVSVLGLGEIVLAGFGGEPFTQYAKVCRDAAPDLFVIAATLINGHQGYLPTTEAYEQGGYEACSSPFQSCLAKQLQSAAIEMIKNHTNQ